MKFITILLLLLLTTSAFGELTKEDLRTIIKEENAALEKRMKEYIDLKVETVNARIDAADQKLSARIDGVEKSIDELDEKLSDRIKDVWHVVLGLIGLIVATVAIPQIIIAYRERGQRAMQSQIDQLREQIEAMNQSINELMHQ